MLSTEDALALVHGLVSAEPPPLPIEPREEDDYNYEYAPPYGFFVVTRRAPGDQLAVDCRALLFCPDLRRPQPEFIEWVRGLMDVLAWLAVCPGLTVPENPRLWQQIVELLVGDNAISGACVTFGDPASFPHWIIAFDAEFGEDLLEVRGAQTSSIQRDHLQWVIEKLFHQSPVSTDTMSNVYAEALARVRSVAMQAGVTPGAIPIGLDVTYRNFRERDGYDADLRSLIQHVRVVAATSTRVRFHSLRLKDVDTRDSHDQHELDALFQENADVMISTSELNMIRYLRWNEDRAGPLERIQLDSIKGGENPTVICAALRSMTKPIDHITIEGDDDLYMLWLVFGLFHWSSRARVRVLELAVGPTSENDRNIKRLLASDRPGKILFSDKRKSWKSRKPKFPLVGTYARLRSRTFTMRPSFYHEDSNLQTVTFDGEPTFEVLVEFADGVGLLIPGHGFAQVERTVIDRMWRGEVGPPRQTDGIQHLIINCDSLLEMPIELRGFGTSLRSLAVRGCDTYDETTATTADVVNEILRACPNLTTLELPTIHLDPLVKAYEEGRCAVTSLVIMNGYDEGPECIQSFLAMLAERNHPGSRSLQNLVFCYHPESEREGWMDVDETKSILRQIMLTSANLQVFFFADEWNRVDVDSKFWADEWQKPHPLISLLSVGGDVGSILRRLPLEVWTNVRDFVGPNRTARVITDPCPYLCDL